MTDTKHLLGLLLGTEEDWPGAFEQLVRRYDPALKVGGDTHRFDVERITIEPFDLRQKSRYDLVVDRLAYWYDVPREWLKKVALMDDAYRGLADDSFEQERYDDFVAIALGDLDWVAVDYFASADFDRLLVETVRATFPVSEHEQFVAHYCELLGAWVRDRG